MVTTPRFRDDDKTYCPDITHSFSGLRFARWNQRVLSTCQAFTVLF